MNHYVNSPFTSGVSDDLFAIIGPSCYWAYANSYETRQTFDYHKLGQDVLCQDCPNQLTCLASPPLRTEIEPQEPGLTVHSVRVTLHGMALMPEMVFGHFFPEGEAEDE